MARNRFDLVGLTRVRVLKTKDHKKKRGQKDMDDGMLSRLRLESHASILDKFSPAWRLFLYKAPSAPAKQDSVPGVPPKQDLSDEAVALGSFPIKYEQTGCKLILHRGVTKIEIKDVTVNKVQVAPKPGESVVIEFDVFATDLDVEVLGEMLKLAKHDADIELLLPEPLQQDVEGSTIAPQTPIGALAGAVQGKGKGGAAGATAH